MGLVLKAVAVAASALIGAASVDVPDIRFYKDDSSHRCGVTPLEIELKDDVEESAGDILLQLRLPDSITVDNEATGGIVNLNECFVCLEDSDDVMIEWHPVSENCVLLDDNRLVLNGHDSVELQLICSYNDETIKEQLVTIRSKHMSNVLNIEEEITLIEGSEGRIEIVLRNPDKSVGGLKFSSSNEEIATVSPEGVVRAINPGKAIVIVTDCDGNRFECEVTVKEYVAPVQKQIVPNSDNANSMTKEGQVGGSKSYSSGGHSVPAGAYGILDIPKVGIWLPTYSMYESFRPIDAPGMAGASNFHGGKLLIGDHNYQGFTVIRYLVPGDVAYFHTTEGTVELEVVASYTGFNEGITLSDKNHRDVSTTWGSDIYALYTCNDNDGYSVWIVEMKVTNGLNVYY